MNKLLLSVALVATAIVVLFFEDENDNEHARNSENHSGEHGNGRDCVANRPVAVDHQQLKNSPPKVSTETTSEPSSENPAEKVT